MFLHVQCAPIGLPNRSDEATGGPVVRKNSGDPQFIHVTDHRAGSATIMRVRDLNGCCGPAPAPRIRRQGPGCACTPCQKPPSKLSRSTTNTGLDPARRRTGLRKSLGGVCEGRYKHRSACGRALRSRCQFVHEVLERPNGGDNFEGLGVESGRMIGQARRLTSSN